MRRSTATAQARRASAGTRRLGAAAALVALALGVQGGGAAAGAKPSPRQSFTLYAVATQSQYVNNADDRARGEGNNPFGNYSPGYVPPPTNEKLFGPFPGDEGEYAFKLYSDAAHKRSAGSAIVICQYGFDEGAFCDAAYALSDGTLIAKGATTFSASRFTLAVVGGTYAYRGVRGTAAVATGGIATQPQPAPRAVPMLQRQLVSFVIHRV